jgi:hypothetical protein
MTKAFYPEIQSGRLPDFISKGKIGSGNQAEDR